MWNWTGKRESDFDFIDQFIADYAINIVERAEESMTVSSLEIARMIVDIHVSRKEILELVTGYHSCKDDGGYEPFECRRIDDGNAENPCPEEHREIRHTLRI